MSTRIQQVSGPKKQVSGPKKVGIASVLTLAIATPFVMKWEGLKTQTYTSATPPTEAALVRAIAP